MYEYKRVLVENPTNSSDWWLLAKVIWPDITTILYNIGRDLDALIDETEDENMTQGMLLHIMMMNEDDELINYLCEAWDDIPDHPMVHSWPSWNRFCNLIQSTPMIFLAEKINDKNDERKVTVH